MASMTFRLNFGLAFDSASCSIDFSESGKIAEKLKVAHQKTASRNFPSSDDSAFLDPNCPLGFPSMGARFRDFTVSLLEP